MKITITETANGLGPVYRFFHGTNFGGQGSWIRMNDLIKFLLQNTKYNMHGIKDIIGKEFDVDESIKRNRNVT